MATTSQPVAALLRPSQLFSTLFTTQLNSFHLFPPLLNPSQLVSALLTSCRLFSTLPTSSHLRSARLTSFSAHLNCSHLLSTLLNSFQWDALNKETFTQRSFCTEKLLHLASFYTQKPLNTEALAHRSFYTEQAFYTEKRLHREAFTQRSFYTEKLLHSEPFALRSFYAEEALTHRSSYTEKLLHRASFTQSKLLHRQAFTQRSFYTEPALHRARFYTQKLLRREAFTQNHLLHNETLNLHGGNMAAEIAAPKTGSRRQSEKTTILKHFLKGIFQWKSAAPKWKKKVACRQITIAPYRTLDAASPIRFTTLQLQKTLVVRTQPQQRGTWTQPFHRDLQTPSCKGKRITHNSFSDLGAKAEKRRFWSDF